MPDYIPNVVRSDPNINIPTGIPLEETRVDPQNGLVCNMHGSMYESSRVGTLFYASAQVAHLYSVALTATYTGLALSNPSTNTKKLVIRAAKLTISAAQAALSYVGLMGGAMGSTYAHTTAYVWGTNMGCLNLGSSQVCTALADEHATIVTPMFLMGFGATALATGAGQETQSLNNLQGAVIVPPGYRVGNHLVGRVARLRERKVNHG
jgi:hypothetical protein